MMSHRFMTYLRDMNVKNVLFFTALLALMPFGTWLSSPVKIESRFPALMVSADSTAIDSLLMRVSRASERVSYSGVQTRLVRHRGQPMELRWREYHWHPDRTLVIFLAPEDLANSTLVLRGEQVKYRGKEHLAKTFRYGGPKNLWKSGQIFKEIALLRRNYRVDVASGPLFLDRATIQLKVSPRYPDRPALNAIVDQKTGLLLQVNRAPVGARDSLALVNQFLEISCGKPDATIFTRAWAETDTLKKRRKATVYSDLASLMTSYEGDVLIPTKIPKGFALLQIKSIQRREKSFLHFLYGDGLTVISLFQRHEEPSHKGGKAGHSSPFVIIRGRQDDISYSIAGEIAREELTEMAESLEPFMRKTNNRFNVQFYAVIILIAIVLFFALRRREKSYA